MSPLMNPLSSAMTTHHAIVFEPSPFRRNSWYAEVPGFRYTIYQSLSGYVVHHARLAADATGSTLAPERLRHFFATFDEARIACEDHYRSTIGPRRT
jgi:hypothetical protein